MMSMPSSCSAVARASQSLRQVVNFIAGEKMEDISLVAYLCVERVWLEMGCFGIYCRERDDVSI